MNELVTAGSMKNKSSSGGWRDVKERREKERTEKDQRQRDKRGEKDER